MPTFTAHLNQFEIREALARYVSEEVGVDVDPRNVCIKPHVFPGNDPREHDYIDATVEYSGKKK